MAFPQDFEVPVDEGGPPFQRVPVGGFGGNPGKTQDEHRAVVQSVGKAPVLLIHGNGGSADTGRWDMLDLNRMLIEGGYPKELIWAPSYLELPSIGWLLFLPDSSPNDWIASCPTAVTFATRLLTEPLRNNSRIRRNTRSNVSTRTQRRRSSRIY
jgi:hypothetical protein